jgi:hypothetical protein
MRFGVVAIAACLLVAQAHADNIDIRDGTGTHITECSKTVAGVEHTCHYVEGSLGGVPTPVVVDNDGKIIVHPFAAPSSAWQASISLSGTANTTLHAACGAGLKNYVTGLEWSTSAIPVANEIDLNDNATPVWREAMAAGGDTARRAPPWDIPKAGSANTAINVQLTGAPVNAVLVNASGYCAQ